MIIEVLPHTLSKCIANTLPPSLCKATLAWVGGQGVMTHLQAAENLLAPSALCGVCA